MIVMCLREIVNFEDATTLTTHASEPLHKHVSSGENLGECIHFAKWLK